MAKRQNTFLIKRSNVPGKVPNPGDLQLGELALNTADVILYASGTTSNQILPIGWDRLSILSGGTVNGNVNINGSISATTYLNLPSFSGDYLPLSGGTVYGETFFTSGITSNAIYTDYIDFNTNPIVPLVTGGTLYFDSNENALSYKPITNQNDVTVNLGQESLIRIYNDLPTTILNGQVLHITGATSGVPTVALANASNLGVVFTESLAQSSGVATHDIPSGEYGFMTNFGVVRDLNTTAFTVGQEVFLSDTIDGGLTNDPNNIAFTSRISTVGYCLESNATTGKILVVITNENPLQSLTQQEVNVLLGNTISTGAYFYTGATTASTTTINVSPMRGWIVYNTGPTYATNPLVLNIYYSGGTNLPVSGLTSSFDTYLLVNSGGTLYQTNTYPTPQERRQNIFLGRVVHPNKTTILNVEQSVDYDVSPLSSLRDLWVPIKIINEGVVPSSNGANLTFKTSSGTFWGNGIGFPTDELNPNAITVPGYLPASFYYTTQTGGTFTVTTTTVDTTKYDVNGVAVNVPGSGSYTTQRIYMSQSGVIRLQYGQNFYSTLAKAIAAIPSETFVVNPDNSIDCILIGLLTVKDGTGDLSNTDDAVFTFVSKFGEILGGTAGISTTTLQQAYNNSVNPEIITNSILGGVQFRGGTGTNTDKNIIIENNSAVETAFIRADGYGKFTTLSATTIGASGNCVTDLYISNIHSCSPLNVQPNNEGNVYFGSTSAVTIDLANNRLGVGIANPTAKLHINNTTSGNTFLVEDDTNPDSTPFVIDSIGRVGIGTTNPGEKVSIVDGSQFIWGSGNTNTGLRLQYGLGTSFWINTPSGGTMSIGGIGTSAPSSGVINITSTGNVGIGTTTPSYLLDVKNEQILGILSGDTKVISKFSGRIGGTGGTNSNNFRIISTRLEDYSSNDWSRTGLRLEASIDDSGTANSWIEFRKPTFSSINNQIVFGESSGSSGQWMIIDNGNVGIGIPIPTEKLHVAGNALITGTTFTGNLIVTGGTGINWISGSTSTDILRITQTGNGNALVVEDSTNPDSSPFVVDAAGNVAVGSGSASNKFIVSNGTNDVFTVNTVNSTVWARGAGNVSSNTSFGENALDSNTTGTSNTAFGQNALTTVTTGSNNSAFGRAALQSSNGNENGGFGVSSLIFLSSGNSNVGLGFQSGIYITDGVTQLTNAGSSIFIGANTKALANNQTNQIVIGHNTTGNGSNSVTLGNDSITKTILQGNVGINTTTPSEKLQVSGNTIVSGTISGGTMVITTQPTSGYTATQILMRNSTTGQVEITDSTSPSIYNYGMTYAMSTFNYLT
jgi:hypothetical protein